MLLSKKGAKKSVTKFEPGHTQLFDMVEDSMDISI